MSDVRAMRGLAEFGRKHAIPIAALLLVGGGAIVLGVRHRAPLPVAATAPVAKPVEARLVPSPSIPPSLLASPPATLALDLFQLLSSPGVRPIWEGSSLPATPAETPVWELREALRETLSRNPAAWPEILDLLARKDNLERSQRIVVLARAAVNDQAEALLIPLLGRLPDSGARRLVVASLAARTSTLAIRTLEGSMVQDTDAAVRLASMTALVQQKDASTSPAIRAEIQEAIHRRGLEETDPEVRDTARNLSGERAPVVQGPPPHPPARRLFGNDLNNRLIESPPKK